MILKKGFWGVEKRGGEGAEKSFVDEYPSIPNPSPGDRRYPTPLTHLPFGVLVD